VQKRRRGREIYPVLERRNQTLRAGIERGLPVRSMADVIGHTVPEQQQELADRLRVHGVFQFHAGALSIAHSDADVERLIAAYAQAAEEMAEAERRFLGEVKLD
jgi:hypothetical protein